MVLLPASFALKIHPNSCRIIILDQTFDFHQILAIQQVEKLKSFSTPCQVQLLSELDAKFGSRRSWILTNQDVLSELIKDVSMTDLRENFDEDSEKLLFTWFIFPETKLTQEISDQIFNLLRNDPDEKFTPNSSYLLGSKVEDKSPTIIHHYAGYNKEEKYKRIFFNPFKGSSQIFCSNSLFDISTPFWNFFRNIFE